VSASVSSLIPAVVDQSAALAEAAADVPDDLLAVLAGVTDPRARRGFQYYGRCCASRSRTRTLMRWLVSMLASLSRR
jgi:hypothetical protein